MKNLFFSAFIVLVGTGAAFATQKADNGKIAIVKGYQFDEAQGLCIVTDQDCSTVFSEDMCTWGAAGPELRELNGTSCVNPLYQVQQN